MKRKILFATLIASSMCFVSCNSNDSTTTSTPLYRGMSVSRVSNTTLDSTDVKSSRKMKKDISELVNKTATNDTRVRYYVNPGETFRLHVCLTNPSKFEIQSLTLNGKKYASYMFSEGSDLENIYIEIAAPIQSGYQNFTLENMKYLEDTQIKDISIGDNNSISVGVRYTNSPVAEFESMKISATSFSTNIIISDDDNLISSETLSFYVTDGTKIISQTQLDVGKNNIALNTLSCSNTYQIGVVGQLDLADGRGQHYEWFVKDEFMTDDIFSFENVNSTENSISFDINKKYSISSTIKQIDLEKDGEVISSLDYSDDTCFMNLLSDTSYDLALHYIANDNTEKVLRQSIKTKSYEYPSISFDLVSADEKSLTLKLNKVDNYNLLKSVSVSLYDEYNSSSYSMKVVDGNYVFENLKSDTSYTAFVMYSYDANDGKGITKKSYQQIFKTSKLDAPTILSKKNSIYMNSIDVEYEISNPDLGQITSLSLLKDGKSVEKVNDSKKTFTSLVEDSDYTVEVSYSYDLNDGKGSRDATQEFTYHTCPKIEILEITSLDSQEKYVVGDSISLKIKINNPNALTIYSLFVNNKKMTYSLVGSYLFVDYTIEKDEFNIGENTLYVSSMIGYKVYANKYNYNFMPSTTNGFVFNYDSDMYVDSITSSSDMDYCNLNDDYYAKISFKNISAQNVKSVTLDDSTTLPVTKNDDGEYVVKLDTSTKGLKSYHIKSVNYALNADSYDASFDQIVQFYVLPDDEVTSITTKEQFLQMEKGKTYSLDADLDFNNEAYTPIEFDGVLRGNNHKIKNLKISIPNDDSISGNYGLFSSASGFIDNLIFENAYMEYDNTSSDLHCIGFIAGQADKLCLRNINLDSSCLIKLKGSSKYLYTGFLVGQAIGNIIIDDCHIENMCWIACTYAYAVSGLIGRLKNTSTSSKASFHRNIIEFSYISSSSSKNVYALYSTCVSKFDVDIADLLVDIDVPTLTSTFLIYPSSSSTVKANHYIDLTTKKVCDTYYSDKLSFYNSFLYLCDSSVSFGKDSNYKVKENCLANDSYYNGQTETITKMIDTNYYYDVCHFDKSIWKFDDPCYTKGLNEYGTTEQFTFKKPTLTRKI